MPHKQGGSAAEVGFLRSGFALSPQSNFILLHFLLSCELLQIAIAICGNILTGKKLERFQTLISLRKYYIPECQECAFKHICATGCPAEAYTKNKNIFSLVGQCEERKRMLYQKIFILQNKDQLEKAKTTIIPGSEYK